MLDGGPGVDGAGFLREAWRYLRTRKRWWLGPLILMLVLAALLQVFGRVAADNPFGYFLF
ncbi:MAG: hypothetical protein HY927_09825 [Elusimicrobia bacterium]|nr:hypothetical protein [Elusimicrobiota bacterium]